MPYEEKTDLPAAVQELPEHAKAIFQAAFNAAYKKHGAQGEKRCFAIAWAAVKQKYVKGEDGSWREKSDSEFVDEFVASADETPDTDDETPDTEDNDATQDEKGSERPGLLDEADFAAADSRHIVTLSAIDLEEIAPAQAGQERTSTVQVARVGSYTDAHGQPIEITEDSLDRMVANFTAQRAGQDVPIDVMHEKREAGGWLKNVWRKGNLLLASVAWNSLGAKLVGDRVYRYLSASIAMPDWVLRSVSLVNFPAIKGLAPVELSEWLLHHVDQRDSPRAPNTATSVQARQPQRTGSQKGRRDMADEDTLQKQDAMDKPEFDFAAALAQAKNEAVQQLSEQIVRELAEKRDQMLAELAQEMQDERELGEFIVQATSRGSHALPVKPDELKTVLKQLPKPQRAAVMGLLNQITQAGTVDFGEIGTSEERADHRRLDPQTRATLKRLLDGGMTVETFFAANPELGDKAGYDLSEFGK